MDLQNFEKTLDKYAALITQVGVNVQPGQTVILSIAVDQAPLAHLIVEKAYALGAAEVQVKWQDDFNQKEFLLHADEERLENIPAYRTMEGEDWVAKGASRISVVSSDPDALKTVDPARAAVYQKALGKALLPVRQATQANKISWTVVAAASAGWAAKVFPTLPKSEQIPALWEAIFKAARVDTPDPVAAWKAHDEFLETKADSLNRENFSALHYCAPGTDLTVGLAKNHLWEGAGSLNARGEKFMANMPTEEVFTAPDAHRVDGVVTSTKPLSYNGTVINKMHLTFKDGKVTDFSAETGQEVLAKLLETDEGAKHLGEVALVPDPSPISRSGITFYNTLFDENASNHLAFGAAYPFNIKGGTAMNESELAKAGLNRSQTHVDFMIGSDQMDIDGIKENGERVPIFRNGDWA
ncbi:aminopeptidase [Enterococcus hirae]|nr:aminopeptidase [Enterococcus hirae]